MEMTFDLERCKELARQAAADGCVLLENRKNCLPLEKDARVAVFGRIQLDYYKSGAGSGGLVNTHYTVGIVEGLQNSGKVKVDEEVLQIYRDWAEENPFDYGTGWAQEPRCQVEMPLSEKVAQEAAKRNDVAIAIIGRLAGEDFDHETRPGSFYLNEVEMDMLRKVRKTFDRMVVLLNVGNIIDMSWMGEIQADSVVYVWQAGQEGGNGVADVLTGVVNPSGRLSDTIAYSIEDYPAYENFGDAVANDYEEDIYVGYRWFETFAKDAVRYPFGYGLSYTEFALQPEDFAVAEDGVACRVRVTNVGEKAGREVVQFYVRQPKKNMDKAALVLVDFGKTVLLEPGQSQTLECVIPKYRFASYDDDGRSGYAYAYVLEAGEYRFLAGQNVRSLVEMGVLNQEETEVVCQCRQAMAPVETLERKTAEGKEKVPVRTYDLKQRIREERPDALAYTGDQGYKLEDVLKGKVTMEVFLAQLTDEDLACMCCGEGMSSPKVTAGTGSAFGGVTDNLLGFGIPIACCTDGPSGIRMDSGAKAFSHPCGTLLACTFDKELNEDLFEMVGAEMSQLRIEVLLGPGINLHRHPLNGRNFEYFSEDPVVTGEMAAAQLRGLHRRGVTACIKHFCANNQELHRHTVSSNISERALRELYLKGYEIAVREGGADAIMTSYGAVNGIWTAGNYDLNTTILRGEWGYTGIVMTDWWADLNEEGQPANVTEGGCMVRAQNDLYMVCSDAACSAIKEDILKSLENGKICRGQLVRCGANICNFVMKSAAMDRMLHPEQYARPAEEATIDTGFFPGDIEFVPVKDGTYLPLEDTCTTRGSEKLLALLTEGRGRYWYTLSVSSTESELAQMPITMFVGGSPMGTHVVHGTKGEITTITGHLDLNGTNAYIRLRFGQSGIKLHGLTFHTQKP